MENATWPYMDPPLFESYWFEKFDIVQSHKWMRLNWTLSLYICATYLTFIFVGKKYMENRAAFDLNGPLTLWNLGFSVFSILGLSRCGQELLHVLTGPNGFHRSLCVRDSHNEPAAFWAFMFTLSKALELGDSVFLVLRKKPVPFIHYYHHSVALLITWCFHSDYEPIFRWFGTCNYFVHSILYTYLFLKSIDINLPRSLSKAIISLELLQMILGVMLTTYTIWIKTMGGACERTTMGITFQMLTYFSFVILFFFLFKTSSKKVSDNNGASRKKVS